MAGTFYQIAALGAARVGDAAAVCGILGRNAIFEMPESEQNAQFVRFAISVATRRTIR